VHLETLREYARRGNLDAVEGLRRRIEGRRVAAVKLADFRRGRVAIDLVTDAD
jgi:hypothetical protein